MMKLSELYEMPKKEGHVGLELECEFRHQRPTHELTPNGWSRKEEGSLRYNGVEYVTRNPLKCNHNKFDRIKALTDVINQNEWGIIKDSPRTSLHVHVNVQGKTPVEIWTQVTAFWLFENLLLKYCGETREGNLFCLRLKDAEALIRFAKEDLSGDLPFSMLGSDRVRYAAQNLKAISSFGSIEYRCMRGVTDPETIHVWSDEMWNLSVKSKEFRSPSHLMDEFYHSPKDRFLNRFFSDEFTEQLVKYKGWDELIEENAPIICELAFAHDWEKWEKTKIDAIKEREERRKRDHERLMQRRNNIFAGVNEVPQWLQEEIDIPEPVILIDDVDVNEIDEVW